MFKKIYECYLRVKEHNKDLTDKECRQVVADVLDIERADVNQAIANYIAQQETGSKWLKENDPEYK